MPTEVTLTVLSVAVGYCSSTEVSSSYKLNPSADAAGLAVWLILDFNNACGTLSNGSTCSLHHTEHSGLSLSSSNMVSRCQKVFPAIQYVKPQSC